MRVFLKKTALADGEATKAYSEIQSLRQEIEGITKEIALIDSRWRSLSATLSLVEGPLRDGRVEVCNVESLEKDAKLYRGQLEEIEVRLEAKKELRRDKEIELKALVTSFNEKYLPLETGEMAV